jgi:hypothetical protein
MRKIWLAPALALTGCFPLQDEPLQTVKPSPFAPPPAPQVRKMELSPATREEALRVDITGQKVVTANRDQTGIRHIYFQTVGSSSSELFHRRTEAVFITEGLSRKCKTEGELAAILAYELGRMIAEREALSDPAKRRPERLPPPEERVGMDSGGTFGPPDGTRLAELAKYEKERPKPGAAPPPPPDPMVLARIYLKKAGFDPKELDAVAPLLQEARASCTLERQIISGQTARPWTQ